MTVGGREGVCVAVGIVVGVSKGVGVAVEGGAVVGAGIVGGEEDSREAVGWAAVAVTTAASSA